MKGGNQKVVLPVENRNNKKNSLKNALNWSYV